MTNGTILVVEDDANLLMGIRDILELENYEILTANNGLDGLEALQKAATPPDIIVSDIMMPHMDGIEFLKKVRAVERFVSIPFIYLTAKGEKVDIRRGKELGVDDYVVKPFNAEELLVAVSSRLGRARAIQRAQQGQQDELKKTILTILNHEFRTPLTFVVAYSDMLSDFNEPKFEPEDAEILTFLNGVRSGADRLRRLIENFIMLVELQTGSAANTYAWRKQTIARLHPALNGAIDAALLIPEEEYRCELEIEPNIPAFVGDEAYLKMAVMHLVDNAFKFSSPQYPVKVQATTADGWLYITVADKGRGIPGSEINNIWNSFYQINRAHYEDQGAGSGLTIVQGVADLHGGRVDVESEPGVGSTFKLSIPLTPPNSGANGKHA